MNYDITAVPELYNVVYMLTNPIGERYIGSTNNLRKRMNDYRRGEGHGLIGDSILKYGFENHQLSILAKNISDKNLRAREYKFIKKIQPELNLLTSTNSGVVQHAESSKKKMSAVQKGHEVTAETRAKISVAQKGKKHTPETRAKLSAANKGKTLSPEHRAKMSAAQKGKKHTPETRAKMSAAKKGIPLSPEHRAKLSAAMKGHEVSPETRAKISAANKGRKHSAEHCAKMSAAQKGKKHTPETRAKISAAGKGRKHTPGAIAKLSATMRKNYHNKNNKRDKKIINMRKKGTTLQAIADCFGLSIGGVHKICRHDSEISKKELAKQFQEQKRNKKIINMRKKGVSYQAIADCFSLTEGGVRYICQQANKKS